MQERETRGVELPQWFGQLDFCAKHFPSLASVCVLYCMCWHTKKWLLGRGVVCSGQLGKKREITGRLQDCAGLHEARVGGATLLTCSCCSREAKQFENVISIANRVRQVYPKLFPFEVSFAVYILCILGCTNHLLCSIPFS